MHLPIRLILAVWLVHAPAAGQDEPSVTERAARLRKILNRNIAPFWYPRCLDRENGGYRLNFGPSGEQRSLQNKMIVTQARMLWYFSRMARAGYAGKEYLEAADLGYRFLRDRMWDEENGGFYWQVDAGGEKVLTPQKHLYGQAFALYGISEYYLATQRKDVLDFAERIFGVLETRAHDSELGGYTEYFNRDWTPPPAGSVSPMGSPAGVKLMNTHMHLMEAMTTFYRASKTPAARERLLELIAIESNSVVRKRTGACTDRHERDWTPVLDAGFAVVSYGHDIENAWLILDACNAAGIPPSLYRDLCTTLWNYALRYGYDDLSGGFYYSGPFNQGANSLEKNWWVQSEALVSALHMHRLTGDPRYLRVFDRTLDWVERYQIDPVSGEWHETVSLAGAARGDKGHTWKAAYHNGRAMIECLELLKK
jgi:mannobiose 2-epimerase